MWPVLIDSVSSDRHPAVHQVRGPDQGIALLHGHNFAPEALGLHQRVDEGLALRIHGLQPELG
jgi:hypothetical protein